MAVKNSSLPQSAVATLNLGYFKPQGYVKFSATAAVKNKWRYFQGEIYGHTNMYYLLRVTLATLTFNCGACTEFGC